MDLIPNFGSFAFTIAAFVAALSIIVTVHEYGHYIVGRWSGIHAEVFSLGFGPVIYARVDQRGTKWQIAAIPLGGYVKFLGDADAASAGKDEGFLEHVVHAEREKELRRSMHGAPLWARSATVAAGPVFNFVFSALIFGGMLFFQGSVAEQPSVGKLSAMPESPSAYDLRPGDVIVGLAGQDIETYSDLSKAAESLTPTSVPTYKVRRDGAVIDVAGPWPYPAIAGSIQPKSAAGDAGIEVGDVILSANGQSVMDFNALVEIVVGSEGQPVDLVVWRNGQTLEKTLTPRPRDYQKPDGEFERRWMIGIGNAPAFEPLTEAVGPIQALTQGVAQVWTVIMSSFNGLWSMITGVISTCNMSGPISIAVVSGDMASQGVSSFIWFVAVLSTAVGLLNLFPIPVLDGGHLVFHAYEAVTRRPPSEGALRVMMGTGLVLILSLMVFALTNDIFCP